jgi:hypothetical protein
LEIDARLHLRHRPHEKRPHGLRRQRQPLHHTLHIGSVLIPEIGCRGDLLTLAGKVILGELPRRVQLVLLPLGKTPLIGTEIDGIKVRNAFALERFGFFVLERAEAGWTGTLYDSNDAVLARCQLSGRALECR